MPPRPKSSNLIYSVLYNFYRKMKSTGRARGVRDLNSKLSLPLIVSEKVCRSLTARRNRGARHCQLNTVITLQTVAVLNETKHIMDFLENQREKINKRS